MGAHAALVGRLLEAANALADDIPAGTREIPDLEGDVRLDELDLYCVGKLTEAAYAINALDAQLAEAYERLALRKANGWELQSSIYEGFTTEIWADARPPGQRTVAIVRDYQDALTIMAALAEAAPRRAGAEAVRRRCENCIAWTSSDSVWGECWRSMDDDARMAPRAPEYGRPDPLETKFNFGCVEWRSMRTTNDAAFNPNETVGELFDRVQRGDA